MPREDQQKKNKDDRSEGLNLKKMDELEADDSGSKVTGGKALDVTIREFINIFKGLCEEVEKYDPNNTISQIKEYLSNRGNVERILYSEISNFIFKITDEKIESNLSTNFEKLMEYYTSVNLDEKVIRIIHKSYDHIQLVKAQSAHISKVLERAKNVIQEEQKNAIREVKEQTKKNLNEEIDKVKRETQEELKTTQKDYITILGIFSSVVIAFFGGMAFSTSILENIAKASVYRLTFVFCLLALFFIHLIYVMVWFILKIHNKEDKIIYPYFLRIIVGAILGLLILDGVAWYSIVVCGFLNYKP